ncbi:sigma-54-dependent transcriptional regulator [Maledivibacter halophilus]|uniref:Stage 0 sporulation protein A homolog n=1 Tax=Maledivibacter halophilus TaxID=36842 RepID=A0A1T5MMQ2_9FIRM|nr:sigma-54 dependent transcriptional regulator [Maledivibacter halophilus]SKC89284.1 DNA-binding transcriptional response regulator, NtrC family, contains REC, AAA-type ATPase, and a Fis-type DNA-binding domains [Maledivibacter halophilus]
MKPQDYKILIVDDEIEYTVILKKILGLEGFSIQTASSAEEALFKLKLKQYDLVLTDLMMDGMNGIELLEKINIKIPETCVILMTAYATIDNAVEAMKKGADSYFVKGNDPEELVSEVLSLYQSKKRKSTQSGESEQQILIPFSKNKAFIKALEMAKKAARSNVNILLLGESGVGKEVFARYIHHESKRYDKSFVAVNCHALQENILESELFGHCKGAFTGADTNRIGRFELAHEGTLFLDEIADTPLSAQIKLLRVLDLKKIERMGSNASIDVDFRLITATNKNLQPLIDSGEFREDFYYRISSIVLEIPPLRKRPEDIQDLVMDFIERSSKEMGVPTCKVSEDVIEILKNYDFPGNIRELKNIVDRLVVFSDGDIIKPEDLPARFFDAKAAPKTLKEIRQMSEKEYIQKVLNENNNRMGISAGILGITRRQLTNKVKEYNLKNKE